MKLRLGTRGSALALAQAELVRARLKALHPSLDVETVVIKTTGDKLSESPLSQIPDKGMFIKEIEEALLARRVDLAVHSMKDLPTDLAGGLAVAAVLEREDPRDCLVSRFGEQLLELPRGSVVGTGSLRRQAQIRAVKKGVRVEEIRGNLDTRLRKVADGDYTAVVVALAGVRRLGREDEVSQVLPYELMLPAPAQGCIAVEVRAGDGETGAFVDGLDHPASSRAAAAERTFLASLGGGCRVPIAAWAREENGETVVDGLVISPDGARKVRGSARHKDPSAAGAALGKKLISEGASELLGPPSGEPGAAA